MLRTARAATPRTRPRSGRAAWRCASGRAIPAPSCTAKTTLVLPASTASSMVSACLRLRPGTELQHLAAGDAEDARSGSSSRLPSLAEAREAPLLRARPAPDGDALPARRAVRRPMQRGSARSPPRPARRRQTDEAVEQAGGEGLGRRRRRPRRRRGTVRHVGRVGEVDAEAEHQPSEAALRRDRALREQAGAFGAVAQQRRSAIGARRRRARRSTARAASASATPPSRPHCGASARGLARVGAARERARLPGGVAPAPAAPPAPGGLAQREHREPVRRAVARAGDQVGWTCWGARRWTSSRQPARPPGRTPHQPSSAAAAAPAAPSIGAGPQDEEQVEQARAPP